MSLTHCSFATESVIILVGSPATTFRVNGNILGQNSEFFRAALKKEWTEGQTRVVQLPEENAATFNTYLNWVYQHDIYLDINEGQTIQEHGQYINYVLAYALGDILMDFDFKDAVSDAFLAATYVKESGRGERGGPWVPSSCVRREIYRMTPDTSLFRKMLVHRMTMATCCKLLDLEDSPQFVIDVALKLVEKDPEDVKMAAAKCKYHEHEPGEKNCYRKKYHQVRKLAAQEPFMCGWMNGLHYEDL